MTIRKGPRQGEPTANLSDNRKLDLQRLGLERAMIYKTLVLTGLRADELRTLECRNLSFGDVPFIKLCHSNEKSGKGSTLALRSDLAAELRAWTQSRKPGDKVFEVSRGILRIMNRDLELARIPKQDADGCVVHVHALRHSFGTHLSLAGVAPRVAQAAMRHSDIVLTMNTYTDARLLDTAEADVSLPSLSIGGDVETTPQFRPQPDAPTDAPNLGKEGEMEPHAVNLGQIGKEPSKAKYCSKTPFFTALEAIGATRFERATSTSRIKSCPQPKCSFFPQITG